MESKLTLDSKLREVRHEEQNQFNLEELSRFVCTNDIHQRPLTTDFSNFDFSFKLRTAVYP